MSSTSTSKTFSVSPELSLPVYRPPTLVLVTSPTLLSPLKSSDDEDTSSPSSLVSLSTLLVPSSSGPWPSSLSAPPTPAPSLLGKSRTLAPPTLADIQIRCLHCCHCLRSRHPRSLCQLLRHCHATSRDCWSTTSVLSEVSLILGSGI